MTYLELLCYKLLKRTLKLLSMENGIARRLTKDYIIV